MSRSNATHLDVVIPADGCIELHGQLVVPAAPEGVVIFAHGSASGRLSPRNRQVARSLNEAAFATLLFDLLTYDESLDRPNVFDIPLLANRLEAATRWVRKQIQIQNLPIGYFGASTGGGAALWAAAKLQDQISAVVSRGGRPDLAIPKLREVHIPTLLIVGGFDEPVIGMNQHAMRYLSDARLVVIPGAGHLFEEAGRLEEVSALARDWFKKHLTRKPRPARMRQQPFESPKNQTL